MKLTLETKEQEDKTPRIGAIVLTPPIDERYWLFRVKVSETQAIVGFPKFATIGIGFAQEDDWNTNLPHSVPAKEIFNHIRHNKGDDSIADESCLAAIRLVQDAAAAHLGKS